jgi:hypothetical protein
MASLKRVATLRLVWDTDLTLRMFIICNRTLSREYGYLRVKFLKECHLEQAITLVQIISHH